MDLLEGINALFEFDVVGWQLGLGRNAFNMSSFSANEEIKEWSPCRPQHLIALSRTAGFELRRARMTTCLWIRHVLNSLTHNGRYVLAKSLEFIHG